MSLYHALFGVNPFSRTLLEMLGTSEGNIPRYRDCFLSEDGEEIIIHTRTGGGNRDHYDSLERHMAECDYSECSHEGPFNEDIRKIPGFKFDEDDDFDSTYADFHFYIPEAFKEQTALLRELGAVSNPAERWQELLTKMKTADKSDPQIQRAMQVGESILGQIKNAMDKPKE